MSKLHSIYAWGVVGVVIVATLVLFTLGDKYWQLLPLLFAVIPLVSCLLFLTSRVPPLATPEKTSGAIKFLKNRGVWLCVFAIFLGGASECTMAQWASGYLEESLGINKALGDIFGVALFAVALGLGRSLYAKFGKNAPRVLTVGAIGAAACYLIAALTPFAVVGLLACALTGFCVSMLWPGSLIVASDRYPQGGVLIFALMAAGGDLGASVGPQLVGVVADASIKNPFILSLARDWGMAPDALGMKIGMLVGMIFPLMAIFVCLRLMRTARTDLSINSMELK
jgi:fucose permease